MCPFSVGAAGSGRLVAPDGYAMLSVTRSVGPPGAIGTRRPSPVGRFPVSGRRGATMLPAEPPTLVAESLTPVTPAGAPELRLSLPTHPSAVAGVSARRAVTLSAEESSAPAGAPEPRLSSPTHLSAVTGVSARHATATTLSERSSAPAGAPEPRMSSPAHPSAVAGVSARRATATAPVAGASGRSAVAALSTADPPAHTGAPEPSYACWPTVDGWDERGAVVLPPAESPAPAGATETPPPVAVLRGGDASVGEIVLNSDDDDRFKAQRSDPDLLLVIACIIHDKPGPPDASATSKFYLSRRESLTIDPVSNLLFWVADGGKQLVVPASSVREVLTAVHDSQFSGHLGVAKTMGKLKERFFWKSMYVDTVAYVRSCEPCCQKKSPPKAMRANFGKMPVPSAPWQWIGMDIAGPFPQTDHDKRYILVVTCAFSKWVETFALPNQEATTIASVLVDQLFCRYGCPSVIHSDQGRNFEANLMKDIFHHLDIKKTRTSSYHPQGNGLVERFNKTVCSMLSMFVAEDQRDWDLFLPKVTFAYNTSVHESTKETPFALFMGRIPRLPVDVTCGAESQSPASLVLSEEKKRDIHQKVSAAISAAAARRADRQAKRANTVSYQVGDFVWLHNPAKKVGRSPKLRRPWEGPYQVIAVLSDCTLRIQLAQGGSRRRSKVVHHDRLKPGFYREDEAYNTIRDTRKEGGDVSIHPAGRERDEGAAVMYDLDTRRRSAHSQGSTSSDSMEDLALVWSHPEEPRQDMPVAESQDDARAQHRVTGDAETREDQGAQERIGVDDPTLHPGVDNRRRRSARSKRPVERYGDWQYDVSD